jgi:hypothetical protein
VRRTLEGVRQREVIAIHPASLTCIRPSTPSTDQPVAAANGVHNGVSANGSCGRSKSVVDGPPSIVDGQGEATVHNQNGQNTGHGPIGGRCGRSDTEVGGSAANDYEVL